jgi:hypothetical protein
MGRGCMGSAGRVAVLNSMILLLHVFVQFLTLAYAHTEAFCLHGQQQQWGVQAAACDILKSCA